MTDANIETAARSFVRGLLRRWVAELPAHERALLRAPEAPAPVPADPFGAARDHARTAHETLMRAPSLADDEAEHRRCVTEAYAHLTAARKYLDVYRDHVIPPATPNPEGEVAPSPAAERSRAFANVILAGFGKAPIRRRRH
jgi:hypothetical protein